MPLHDPKVYTRYLEEGLQLAFQATMTCSQQKDILVPS